MTTVLDRSIAPEVRPLPMLHLPQPETILTPGGLPLVVLKSATCDAPVFQLKVVVGGAGSLDIDSRGVALLYPLMLNQGSEGLDGNTLSEIFEGAGAWLNIGSNNHFLDATVRGIVDTAPDILPAMAKMLATPLFPADRLAVLAETQAMQRAVELTKPKALAREATAAMFWGQSHRGAYEPAPEDIRGVGHDDLVLAHRLFSPRRITLYLCGNISRQLIDAVAEAFDKEFAFRMEGGPEIWQPDLQSPLTEPGSRLIEMAGSRQAAVSMRIPSILRSHPDYEMLRIAVTGLGGYFGSRLNSILREERGLTYGVNAGLIGSLDGTSMTVATECRTEAAEEALAVIESEIQRFVEEPPEGEELKRLLGFCSTRLAAILDSPFTILDTAAVQVATLGTPVDYFDRTQAAIKSAIPAELSRVVYEHIVSQPRCTAIVK